MSVRLFNWVFSHSNVDSPGPLAVMLAIADFADDEGYAYPTIATIAAKARLKERAVQYILHQQVEAGELEITAGAGPGGAHMFHIISGLPQSRGAKIAPVAATIGGAKIAPVGGAEIAPGGVQTLHQGGVQSLHGGGANDDIPLTDIKPSGINHQVLTSNVGSTVSKTNPGDDVRRVSDHYKLRIQPKARLEAHSKIGNRLKRFSPEELIAGIDHFADSQWWMDHNSNRGAEWFFNSDSRSEQFLLMEPAKPDRSNGHTTVALRRAPDPDRVDLDQFLNGHVKA